MVQPAEGSRAWSENCFRQRVPQRSAMRYGLLDWQDFFRDLSFLYQNVDATKYRGKMLTYRASVRADVASGAMARLLVRVHRMDCSTSFRDDMGDHPITASGWSSYQLHAPIGQDARDIEFGMQLIGSGAAWIDNITMTFADAK